MVTAIQDIGQDLLDAINQTPNCSRYANTSRPQDAITAFRDTLGEIRVNATQSAQNETSMSANPDGSLNIPSIAIRGLRNDCSPAKNCFYNIFVHELSHFIDYRATLAAGYSSDELLNRVVNEVTIPGQTVIGEDYIYHNPRNYNLDRGLTRINPAQTAGEYAADVLANLFLDAFDRQYDVADDQPSQRRLEQAQSLLSRAICGGTFLDTNGNPNVDSNN